MTSDVSQIVEYAAAAAAALCTGPAAAAVYMRLPAGWLCDFDEAPCELHMPGFRGTFSRTAGAAFFVCVSLAAFAVYSAAGLYPWTAAALICLAAAALSDIEYMIIPDQLLLAAAICALAAAGARGMTEAASGVLLYTCGASVKAAALGALAGGGLMLLSALAAAVFYGAGAIGTGDIKMLFVCGALAGSPERAVMLFAASCFGSALFISVGIVAGRLRREAFIPMGPFIALAATLCMC